MTTRNTAPAKPDAPLENLKPRRGMLVTLFDTPGVWQVIQEAPGAGAWWLNPWDTAAREAPHDREWGAYRKATYRTMRPARG